MKAQLRRCPDPGRDTASGGDHRADPNWLGRHVRLGRGPSRIGLSSDQRPSGRASSDEYQRKPGSSEDGHDIIRALTVSES